SSDLEQLERDQAVLAAAAEREELDRPVGRAQRRRRRRDRIDEPRALVRGQIVLVAPLRPHVAKHRAPQPDEVVGQVARIAPELDHVGAQAARRVELEQRDVDRDPLERLVAELPRERREVDVLVPDRHMKPQVVERAARDDVICAAMNVDELQGSHDPRLPEATRVTARAEKSGALWLRAGHSAPALWSPSGTGTIVVNVVWGAPSIPPVPRKVPVMQIRIRTWMSALVLTGCVVPANNPPPP